MCWRPCDSFQVEAMHCHTENSITGLAFLLNYQLPHFGVEHAPAGNIRPSIKCSLEDWTHRQAQSGLGPLCPRIPPPASAIFTVTDLVIFSDWSHLIEKKNAPSLSCHLAVLNHKRQPQFLLICLMSCKGAFGVVSH